LSVVKIKEIPSIDQAGCTFFYHCIKSKDFLRSKAITLARINQHSPMFRKILIVTLIVIGSFLLIASILIAPIDYRPWEDRVELRATVEKAQKSIMPSTSGENDLFAGWARVNITPSRPISMAGYGPRGTYNSVHDSLFCNTVVFDNGAAKAVIISLDMLLVPNQIRNEVTIALEPLGFSATSIFLSATHTHSGFGNWEKSIAGRLAFGNFYESIQSMVASRIIESVLSAQDRMAKVSIGFVKADASELVANRLSPDGNKDPFIRAVVLKKLDGKIAIITAFSGHATNLNSNIRELSRDYPGVLTDELEKLPDVEFAMFCAGMVGSHSISLDLPKGQERIEIAGKLLAGKIESRLPEVTFLDNASIGSQRLEIELPQSQLRITENLRLRSWVFDSFFGALNAEIYALDIDGILLIGMPCDFSGELSVNNQLDSLGYAQGKHLFVTSFNGAYIGYITEDRHYANCTHDEVRFMNWVGPGMGSYFVEITKVIIGEKK